MSSDSGDRSDDVALALDQLGAAAVAEAAGEPPQVRREAARRRPLLAVAAAVVLLACGSVAVVVARSTPDESVVAAPSTTSGPDSAVPTTWPSDELVAMSFSPDRALATSTLVVTITNNSEEPWTFDCLAGVLSRWDGEQMVALGSTIWTDDHLSVTDDIVEPRCSGATPELEPGASEVRVIRLDAITGDDGTHLVLEPGIYQLLFPNEKTFTGAIGQFEVYSPDADPAGVTTTAAPVEDVCDTAEGREAAAVIGAATPTASMDGPGATASCSIDAGALHVTYWFVDVPPEQFGAMGSSEGGGIDLGDESFLTTTMDRSGRWVAHAGVRVGQRAVSVDVRSDASGADTYPPVEGSSVEPTVRAAAVAVATQLAAGLD